MFRPCGFAPLRRLAPRFGSGLVASRYRMRFVRFVRGADPAPRSRDPTAHSAPRIHTLRRLSPASSRTASLRPFAFLPLIPDPVRRQVGSRCVYATTWSAPTPAFPPRPPPSPVRECSPAALGGLPPLTHSVRSGRTERVTAPTVTRTRIRRSAESNSRTRREAPAETPPHSRPSRERADLVCVVARDRPRLRRATTGDFKAFLH